MRFNISHYKGLPLLRRRLIGTRGYKIKWYYGKIIALRILSSNLTRCTKQNISSNWKDYQKVNFKDLFLEREYFLIVIINLSGGRDKITQWSRYILKKKLRLLFIISNGLEMNLRWQSNMYVGALQESSYHQSNVKITSESPKLKWIHLKKKRNKKI